MAPNDQDSLRRWQSEPSSGRWFRNLVFLACVAWLAFHAYGRIRGSKLAGRPGRAVPVQPHKAAPPPPASAGPVADFSLLDQDGVKQSLSGLAAVRPVVLYGFSGDCAHCNKELGRMAEALGSPAPGGLAYVGLMHQGTPQDARAIRDAYRLPGSVLADADGSACGRLGIGEFTLLLLDRELRPIFRGGADGLSGALASLPNPVPASSPKLPAAEADGTQVRGFLFRDARRHLAKDWDPARDRALSAEEEASIPPLLAAVNRRQAGKVRELVASGADVNAEWRGVRPMHLALDEFFGDRGLVEALLEGGAKRDILAAAGVGSEEDLRRALASGESRDLRTPMKKSALHLAVHYQRAWAVKMLLDAGVHPDPLDHFDRTPLSWSMQGPSDISMILIERGADVNRLDGLHQSPLYYAVSYGKTDVVRSLLDRGADPKVPGQQGFTCLHMAAQFGRDGIARILLDHGADPNARDRKGEPPLLWARRHGQAAVAAVLESHGARD